ncbi:MAG: DUF1778 domain-containing protein [Propionibacteriaceae bacterium]|jgi:uncharacterized protein (DUF1778 family)|nr:DUF1778 domain-containing protein [Propionibacteriaceae bacterium]
MATTEDRLEFRLPAPRKARLRRAAELVGEPLSVFVREAAEDRADQVLRVHDATIVVPDEHFDELLAALDEPPKAAPALVAAFTGLDQIVSR